MTREYQVEGVYVNETTEDEFQVETVYLNETVVAAAGNPWYFYANQSALTG